MTEQEWFRSNDFVVLVESLLLDFNPSARKLYLLGCACARNVPELATNPYSKQLIDTVEKYANNACSFDELERSMDRALEIIKVDHYWGSRVEHWINSLAMMDGILDSPTWAISVIPEYGETMEMRKGFLHDIFGNPFRPVDIKESWINADVLGLAKDGRDHGILADALEDAGCHDARILKHLRESHMHVNGCWVYDLILGKQ